MTLTQFYSKIPVSEHQNIICLPGNMVAYDDGTNIYNMVIGDSAIPGEGQLKPLDMPTKTLLKAL